MDSVIFLGGWKTCNEKLLSMSTCNGKFMIIKDFRFFEVRGNSYKMFESVHPELYFPEIISKDMKSNSSG